MTSQIISGGVGPAGRVGLIGQAGLCPEAKLAGPPWKQIQLIAAKEFADRFRSGWVIACVTVWLGAVGLTSFFGLIQIGHFGAQGYERTVISLLNIVQYLIPLLGLLLGHDLIVSENEDRTLKLLLTSGVSRARLLLGKFLGGCVCLGAPLLGGFLVAGAAVGFAAKDNAVGPFVTLAFSGLGLGIVFVALGLTISVWSRSRVQALVISLLAWCFFVFVFDLIAMGVIVSSRAPAAAREIEVVCDATHVNSAADIHSAPDAASEPAAVPSPTKSPSSASMMWLALNPVDVFRAVNLGSQTGFPFPGAVALGSVVLWLGCAATVSSRRFLKIDL
jgi:Cu-processing system permease protein